jgi:hypothetical protein
MKRLKSNHPTSIKLEKIHSLMEELGITIAVSRYGKYIVHDNEWPGQDMIIKDLDDSRDVVEFPPAYSEYKLIIED